VGDPTSSAQRAADPTGWALGPAVGAALAQVIGARRDVRRFRPDPVPDDVLTRVLQAGHEAPSVGHSQPWRFLVVAEPALREQAATMAERERLRQAALLDEESRRGMLDLQLDGLREAPLGIVVCCDRRVPAAGVLGRATFPDADLWSCACAIQNIWLTARAEGLGLGWVTLLDPAALASLLDLPDGVVTLGWLCLGWPDERPPEPGLQRAGWSRRAPLSTVVMTDRWSQTPPPVSHLRAPAPVAVLQARDNADALLTPTGSLGLLDRVLDRVAALAHTGTGCLVLAGADHPVTRHGVSTFPASTTRTVLQAAIAGEALGVVLAHGAGIQVRVVDAGVDPGPVPGAWPARPQDERGDLVTADALSAGDVRRLLAAGREHGRAAASSGLVLLAEVGIGNTTVAAALAGALLGLPAGEVVGLGAGGDSATLQRKREAVTLALQRCCDPADPIHVLQMLGGAEIALLAGVVLGAAGAGAPVVLDGLATSVAALVAARLEPAVTAHLVAGQRSREVAHPLVLTELGLEPLLDLRLKAGEGVGAVLAAGLISQGLQARMRTGRTS
jgi:nicotinate-nucleotide--dimethylbenzimidazole phosphoribosyltransferase